MDNEDKPILFRPAVGNKGMTELHYAAYCGDIDTLKECLANGMDPNQKDEYRKYTAAHWVTDMSAVYGPRLEMLKELINAGADLTIKAINGETVLSLAKDSTSELGNEIVNYLHSIGVKD